MYVNNSAYGVQTAYPQTTYAQPQVVAKQIAPTGYVSPFAIHGGYYQPPVHGTGSQNLAPAPQHDPYTVAYNVNHPSYIPREPIHPSEMMNYTMQTQTQQVRPDPVDAWEYEMQRKEDRDERLNRRREPGSLFGWDPRDPPAPRRDLNPNRRVQTMQGGTIRSIE